MCIGKRILSCILSVVICLGSVSMVYAEPLSDSTSGGDTGTQGSANNLISAYISMAAGKATTDESFQGLKFTKDDLQFLGMYASNYFVPFGTEFGAASTSTETTDASMEAMKKGLQTGLKFSDAYAKTFAENIVGLARSSVQKLEMGVSKTYNGSITTVGSKVGCSYYSFLSAMLGAGNGILGQIKNKTISGGGWKFIYFGYTKGGQFTPVFDASLDVKGSGYTPSQAAFLKCLESVGLNSGYGLNAFDLNPGDIKDGKDIKELEDDNALKITAMGIDVAVDCFGDIILCGLQHQVVAVPGCVNPYSWVAVDSSGKDILKAGHAYQMINLMSMDAADKYGTAKALYRGIGNATVSGTSGGKADGGSIANCTAFSASSSVSKALRERYNLMHARNKSNAVKSKAESEYNMILSNLDYMFEYADAEAGVDNYNVVYDSSTLTVKVSGKFASMASLKSGALNESYGASVSKKKNRELKLSELSKVGISRSAVQSGISVAQKYAESKWSGKTTSSEVTETSDTKVKLKSMVMNYKTLDSQVAGNKGKKDTKLAMNLYRGSPNETGSKSLTKKFFSTNEPWKKTWETAKKVYSTKYTEDKLCTGNFTNTGIRGYWAVVGTMGKSYNTTAGKKTKLVDGVFLIDNLGAFNFDSGGQDVEYSALHVGNYVGSNGKTLNASGKVQWTYGSANTFSAGYSNIQDGTIPVPTGVADTTIVSIYTSYLIAGLYEDSSKPETIGRLGYRIGKESLPDIPDEPLEISAEAKSDLELQAIRDWLYYLLHPTEGLNYFRELLTNKLNSFLVGLHNDMNGTFGVGQTTGTTTYRNNYGYVTTPDLSEIEWSSSLIDFYNNAIPFLIIAMIVTMLLSYLTGVLSLQKSIFGVLIFAVFLFMPVTLINGVVGTSNRVSSNIYGEKFTYWALVQQESYSSKIQEAADGESYGNYLRTLYDQNSKVYKNQGGESIVLKWQAPKKMASLMLSGKDNETVNGLKGNGSALLKGMFNSAYSGESYTGNSSSVYMYRSYLDISNFSQYIYRGLSGGSGDPVRPRAKDLNNSITSSWDDHLKGSVSKGKTIYATDRTVGYANKNGDGSDKIGTPLRVYTPLSSSVVTDALKGRNTVKDLKINDFVGINQDYFNFSIPMFNKKEPSIADAICDNASEGVDVSALKKELGKYTDEDLVGLAVYGIFSENVFYYFSWDLYDMGLATDAGTNDGFKNLLLGQKDAGFFYNKEGNGELKDFMDMRSLFTYTIPYMKMCNELVHEWDRVYGIFTYEGVPSEEGHWDDADIEKDKEMKQKYWHNLNVARLYGMYCPWVDVMYDCSYAEPTKLKVQGTTYVIEDPLDPSSYPKERPMVFSRSEMVDYGLTDGDLTKAEQKIMDCNEGMQERLFDLLNYYNFNDVTLNTAGAMNCAFEFNKTFSENGIIGHNNNIYPQSFELGDFSYDAFLRFILSNTTGESMLKSGDFYDNIVQNSSTTTAVALIILDIISIYVLPAFKIFFIIAVFLLSIMIILTTAFRVDPEQKFITKVLSGLFKPMLAFLAINIGFAFVVSLFMGVGSNAVTQTKDLSISMGDPVTVMVAMVALNIAVVVLFWKVLSRVVRMLIKETKLVGGFMTGVVGSVWTTMSGATGMNRLSGNRANGTGGQNGRGNVSQEGTGSMSSRAASRGSTIEVDKKEDRKEDSRQNDVKRSTIKNISEKDDSRSDEDRMHDINSKSESGSKRIFRSLNNKVKDSNKQDRG